MNGLVIIALMILAGISAILAAAYLAIKGIQGWGWFLIVGLLIIGGISYASKSSK